MRRASGRRWARRGCGAALLAALLALPPSAAAGVANVGPWPPGDQPGTLFAHYGEEHINDADGGTLLPKVVHEVRRYRPAMVTMSGDKADDGETEQLAMWMDVMKAYDRAGIPWFAAVGNHDRKAPPGLPGGVSFVADFSPYRLLFADRPYPMGDAEPYEDPRISPGRVPEADPAGASSHYYVDYGPVRWVFIDNSCWSIVLCDLLQNPSAQNKGGEGQLEFLKRVGEEAGEQGKLVFVVMHMPTEDPGDQSYRDAIAVMHTMGKSVVAVDNILFERTAAEAGVDAVFVAHIKGQFLYEGTGGIPYFIDGGAGGELYTTGPVGVDHGYWHGFRLINVRGERFRTDAVPIFVPGGIKIVGPRRMGIGESVTFAAFGRQPVFNDPAKVEALELRDPDPVRARPSGAGTWLGDLAPWVGPPLAVLALIGLTSTVARRRRLAIPVLAVAGAACFAAISGAQQSEPTNTPTASLPNPARMWTTSDPGVLAPVASASDDARRRERTQTADGRFRAVCPGAAMLTIASGFETRTARIRVRAAGGPPPARCDNR